MTGSVDQAKFFTGNLTKHHFMSLTAAIGFIALFVVDLALKDARILSDPVPVVHVVNLGERAVSVRLRVWTKTQDHWDVRFDLIEATKLAFDKAAIEIPQIRQSAPAQFVTDADQQTEEKDA